MFRVDTRRLAKSFAIEDTQTSEEVLAASRDVFFSKSGKLRLSRIWQRENLGEGNSLCWWSAQPSKNSVRENVSDFLQSFLIERTKRLAHEWSHEQRLIYYLSKTKSPRRNEHHRESTYEGTQIRIHHQKDCMRRKLEHERMQKLIMQMDMEPTHEFLYIFNHPLYRMDKMLIRIKQLERMSHKAPCFKVVVPAPTTALPKKQTRMNCNNPSPSDEGDTLTLQASKCDSANGNDEDEVTSGFVDAASNSTTANTTRAGLNDMGWTCYSYDYDNGDDNSLSQEYMVPETLNETTSSLSRGSNLDSIINIQSEYKNDMDADADDDFGTEDLEFSWNPNVVMKMRTCENAAGLFALGGIVIKQCGQQNMVASEGIATLLQMITNAALADNL